MSRPSAGWLTFAAGCAVASALLGLAANVDIILGSVLSLLSPAPVMLAYARLGVRQGRLTAGAALLLALMVTGFDPAGLLFYAAMCLPLAITAGEMIRAGQPTPKAIGGGALVGILVMAGTMTIGTGGDLGSMEQVWQMQWAQVETTIGHIAEQDKEFSPEQKAEVIRQLRSLGRLLYHTTPGIIFGFCLLVTWGNVLLTRQIAAKFSGVTPRRISTWQAPFHLVWFLAAALALATFADGWAFWLGINAIIALCMIYFLQGLGVLTHFMLEYNVPQWFRVCVYVLVFVASQTSLILLAAAGLFDTWFNLRRFAARRPN